MKTYTLITTPGEPDSIHCKRCGLTSHHPKDVENLYCGKCGPHTPKNVERLEDDHAKFYTDMGYGTPIRLDGKIVALGRFIYTVAILVGLDETGYECRYCYHTENDAMIALLAWIGSDEMEPAGYITKK